MAYLEIVILVLGFQCLTVAGEYCYAHGGFTYCQNGCCGDYNSPCCNEGVAAIVGGIIGGIFLLSIIVIIVCCCIRRRGAQGAIVRGPQAATTTISTVQYPTGGVMYPQTYPTGYPAQPGPYSTQPFVYGQPAQSAQPMSPPPYSATAGYPSGPQGYPNAGFTSDTTQQSFDTKDTPSAPYDANSTMN